MMKNAKKFVAFAAMAAAVVFAYSASADPKGFTVTINYTGTSATNVPTLFSLSESAPAGFSYADTANGTDFEIFDDATGALLPYEIDTWDPEGTSLLWVKVPVFAKDRKLTVIYGRTSADMTVNATNVWSGYAGVWHMNDTTADGKYPNSTGAAVFDGEVSPYSATNQTGDVARFGKSVKIYTERNYHTGKGGTVPGSDTYPYERGGVFIPDNGNMNLVSNFVVSGWFYHTTEAAPTDLGSKEFRYDYIFTKRGHSQPSDTANDYLGANRNSGFGFRVYNNADAADAIGYAGSNTAKPTTSPYYAANSSSYISTYEFAPSDITPADNKLRNAEWRHLSFVVSHVETNNTKGAAYSTCTVKKRIDGTAYSRIGDVGFIKDNDEPLVIGNTTKAYYPANNGYGDRAWGGYADEVRLIIGSPSAEWLAAEYAGMAGASLTYGPATGVYVVPPDTTVRIDTAADFETVNSSMRVIFSNSNSVLRFSTKTLPTVPFQGPGSAVFEVAPILTNTWTLGRVAVSSDEPGFTRFVFEDGIANDNPTAARVLKVAEAYQANTVIAIDGILATNVTVRYSGDSRYGYLNGRFDFGENFEMDGDRIFHIGYGDGAFGVVRQRGGFIVPTGNDSAYLGGDHGVAAYFLEGGVLCGSRDYYKIEGDYVHFRQTGGAFTNARFQVAGDAATKVRGDFVFGGNGKAYIHGRTTMRGEMLFAFTDSVDFTGAADSGSIAFNMYYATNTIWAYNGGVADFQFRSGWSSDTANQASAPTNAFHAFNGGARCLSRILNPFGHSPKVRVYEKGAEIRSGGDARNALWGEISAPEGKALQSIAMSDELKARVWPAPPSVHITDTTGYGAAAVVDYDFDTGRITNITVMSKGENYTAPTANLRYHQDEQLVSAGDLVCVVGDEPTPSCLIFSARKPGAMLQPSAFTNHLACTTIIDMDMDDIADHGKTNKLGNVFSFGYASKVSGNKLVRNVTNGVYFPNCTNIVLKSGELRASYLHESDTGFQFGYNHEYVLPSCYRIELYGGHFVGGTARFADVVIGGEVWLYSNQGAAWAADIHTTHDNASTSTGCLTIDAARGTNGTCTSVLKGGGVNHGEINFIKTATSNSCVTVKNWESIPASRPYKVLLDLSEVTVNRGLNLGEGASVGVPDIVYPEGSEGQLSMKWEMNPDAPTKPYKLLARRISAGTMIIFR